MFFVFLEQGLKNRTKKVRLGFGTFIEKPVFPFSEEKYVRLKLDRKLVNGMYTITSHRRAGQQKVVTH